MSGVRARNWSWFRCSFDRSFSLIICLIRGVKVSSVSVFCALMACDYLMRSSLASAHFMFLIYMDRFGGTFCLLIVPSGASTSTKTLRDEVGVLVPASLEIF